MLIRPGSGLDPGRPAHLLESKREGGIEAAPKAQEEGVCRRQDHTGIGDSKPIQAGLNALDGLGVQVVHPDLCQSLRVSMPQTSLHVCTLLSCM